MNATVLVYPRREILDPQGKAIAQSLNTIGFDGVEDIRAGKAFRIALAETGQSREEVQSQLRAMCEKLLANTVVEDYSITLDD